jgi:hypothetical protein
MTAIHQLTGLSGIGRANFPPTCGRQRWSAAALAKFGTGTSDPPPTPHWKASSLPHLTGTIVPVVANVTGSRDEGLLIAWGFSFRWQQPSTGHAGILLCHIPQRGFNGVNGNPTGIERARKQVRLRQRAAKPLLDAIETEVRLSSVGPYLDPQHRTRRLRQSAILTRRALAHDVVPSIDRRQRCWQGGDRRQWSQGGLVALRMSSRPAASSAAMRACRSSSSRWAAASTRGMFAVNSGRGGSQL